VIVLLTFSPLQT